MACGGDDNKKIRIVMLGKTGAGKSTLGNTLLGKNPPGASARASQSQTHGFAVGRGVQSVTMYCKCDTAVRFGTSIEVTDTPGLLHTHLQKECEHRFLENVVAMTEPGPHIILVVLRCDSRVTQQDYAEIKRVLLPGMGRFLIIVFNGLDAFEGESLKEKRKLLDEELKDSRFEISDILREAEGRYFGMDNRASEEQKELQAKELIKLMQDLVERNRGNYFSTEQTETICKKLDEMTMVWALNKGMSYAAAKPHVKQNVIERNITHLETTNQDWCSIS